MIVCTWHPGKDKTIGQRADQWLPGARGKGRGWLQRTSIGKLLEEWSCSVSWLWWWFHGWTLWPKLIELFYKRVDFTVCKLYLIKFNSFSAPVRQFPTPPLRPWEPLGTRTRAPRFENRSCHFWWGCPSEPPSSFKILIPQPQPKSGVLI